MLKYNFKLNVHFAQFVSGDTNTDSKARTADNTSTEGECITCRSGMMFFQSLLQFIIIITVWTGVL